MKFSIIFDKERAAVDIRYEGEISFATWVAAQSEMTSLENGTALQNARYVIADYSNATLSKFTNFDLASNSVDLIMQTSVIKSNLTVVSIAPNNLDYGLMRMLQGFVEDKSPWESYLVRTREECDKLLVSLE